MRQFGTVLAIDLAGGISAAEHLLSHVTLVRVATSLGGPETLVCHPRTTTHASLTDEEASQQGVSGGLLRVSVGLEDPSDLLADLLAALPA
jgi:cystathionine beta-lyase/cystathionine gamma-synthase